MQSLIFAPLLKRIRWGGRRLGTVLGKDIGAERDYAESWEVSDHGEDQSVVADGPLTGWTLARLVAERNAELFGRHAGLTQFPLLVKFLDANDRLSVQVHPDDRLAKQFDATENGKTETWTILDAQPGSRLYVGLKQDIDAAALRTHLEQGTVEECLHAYPVAAGDCVFVEAGTVHAIGEGILLAEIQQSSDLTFRLYDWGRLGTDGKPRPIHIEEALTCVDFDRGPVDPLTPRPVECDHACEELARCDYFVTRRHRLTTGESYAVPDDNRFHVLLVLEGQVQLDDGTDEHVLNKGRTVVLPAARQATMLYASSTATLLETFLP